MIMPGGRIMPFTIIFAVLGLVILAMLFAIIWKIRDLKTALMITGFLLVVFAALYVTLLFYIASVM
jgi:hypothetical protein